MWTDDFKLTWRIFGILQHCLWLAPPLESRHTPLTIVVMSSWSARNYSGVHFLSTNHFWMFVAHDHNQRHLYKVQCYASTNLPTCCCLASSKGLSFVFISFTCFSFQVLGGSDAISYLCFRSSFPVFLFLPLVHVSRILFTCLFIPILWDFWVLCIFLLYLMYM